MIVTIGGEGTLTAQEAYKLAVKRESALIIPIVFGSVGEKDALKTFLKEAGDDSQKPMDKLTVKKKDVTGKQGEVVVLRPAV